MRYPAGQSQSPSAQQNQQGISSCQHMSLLRSCIAMDHWHTSFRQTEIPPSLPGGVYLPSIKFLVLLNHLHFSEVRHTWRKQGGNIYPCITLLASVLAWQSWALNGSLEVVDEDCGQSQKDVNFCRYSGHETVEGDNSCLHLYPH